MGLESQFCAIRQNKKIEFFPDGPLDKKKSGVAPPNFYAQKLFWAKIPPKSTPKHFRHQKTEFFRIFFRPKNTLYA